MSFDPQTHSQQVHRWFAADCFNRVWSILDKATRSSADDEQMVLLAHASLWHWTQREDCRDRHLSIGYWLLSRVHSVLGRGTEARRYAEMSLQRSRAEGAFYRGYAYEALARAALVQGERTEAFGFLDESRRCLALIEEAGEQRQLAEDLNDVEKRAKLSDRGNSSGA